MTAYTYFPKMQRNAEKYTILQQGKDTILYIKSNKKVNDDYKVYVPPPPFMIFCSKLKVCQYDA